MNDALRPQSPDMADILQTVQAFLKECEPQLASEDRYKAQVASYLLGICAREIAYGPSRRDGAEALCADIRAGRRDGDWDGLLDQLLEEARAAVQVTKPGHLGETA
ncbi:MAG: DUF6285 domain-containing protein [Pseudomonadota bacterium]|uniref:DUF6285 domain-containing protein n=1 Tax=Rhizorhabdus phycosphaerae TaxID=2711156 RepID=UPI0019D0B4A9|nr:DUF6285 domain-containing protein [Rhizorhabdus phycosphaerae]